MRLVQIRYEIRDESASAHCRPAGAIYPSQSNNQSRNWVSGVWAINVSRVCTKTFFRIFFIVKYGKFWFGDFSNPNRGENFGNYLQENIRTNLSLNFLWMQMCWCYSVIWFNQMIGRFRDRDGSDSNSTPTDGAAPTPITNDDLDTMFDKTQRQIRYKISINSCLIFVLVHCSSILMGFWWVSDGVLMGFHGVLMGFSWVLMDFNGF